MLSLGQQHFFVVLISVLFVCWYQGVLSNLKLRSHRSRRVGDVESHFQANKYLVEGLVGMQLKFRVVEFQGSGWCGTVQCSLCKPTRFGVVDFRHINRVVGLVVWPASRSNTYNIQANA